MSFRIWTIFYVFAVVGAGLATFGVWGLLPAAIVLCIWVIVFTLPKPASALGCIVCGGLLIVLILLLLLPAVSSVREASRRGQCLNQTRMVGLALIHYESTNGYFPSAFVSDASGQPLQSWRVLVLPIMEYQSLFERMDLFKPWNDPNNLPVTKLPLDWLQCPVHHPRAGTVVNGSDYLAVVDPRTMWPGSVGRKVSEIKDGAATTILLIESHGINANWAEPRDLTFEETVALLATPAREGDGHYVDNGFFYKPGYGRCVAFADGHVAFLGGPLSREVAAALLTVDGGEDVSAELNAAIQPQLDYGNCYGLGVFLVLAVLPVGWLRGRGKMATEVTT